MLLRLLYKLGQIAGPLMFLAFLFSLTIVSTFKQAELSNKREIQSADNISTLLSNTQATAVSRSRNSAVNIMSISEEGYVSSSSGTYLLFKDNFYVITVSHGLIGDCSSIRIITEESMYECVDIKILDTQLDYAVIQIEKIPEREAIRIPRHYPHPNEWSDMLSVQRNVYYTGYPNGIGPLTFGGQIVGYESNEDFYLHSFGWPGSSGSGVFSETGELIGLVIAISVGTTELGINVLEDIVIVTPMYKVNWNML